MTDHTTLITFIILNRAVIINISLYNSYVPLEGWLIHQKLICSWLKRPKEVKETMSWEQQSTQDGEMREG